MGESWEVLSPLRHPGRARRLSSRLPACLRVHVSACMFVCGRIREIPVCICVCERVCVCLYTSLLFYVCCLVKQGTKTSPPPGSSPTRGW